MITSEYRPVPIEYRLPIQDGNVPCGRLGVVAEHHLLRHHLDRFASCATLTPHGLELQVPIGGGVVSRSETAKPRTSL